MGFMKKSNCGVNVQATLTGKGRMTLITNPAAFEISKFAAGDSIVDYRMWNTKHPDGTKHFGESIENKVNLEPCGEAAFHDRQYKMVLNMDPEVIKFPLIETRPVQKTALYLEKIDSVGDFTLYFKNIDVAGLDVQWIIVDGDLAKATVTSKHNFKEIDQKAIFSKWSEELNPKSYILQTSAAASVQIGANWNDQGDTDTSYRETAVIVREVNSGAEYQFTVQVQKNNKYTIE